MRRMVSGIFVALLLSALAMGQDQPSLGDVARVNREKQQAQEAAGVTPKVITNKDLPAQEPAGIPEANPADPMTQVSGVPRPMRVNPESARPFRPPFEEQGFPERPSGGPGFGGPGFPGHEAESLRSRIQEQESRIAELQARIDRASAMMHPNSTAQYEGPGNRYQAMQAQRIEMMQQQLDLQKQRLAAMQDAARRQGAHTSVYDP